MASWHRSLRVSSSLLVLLSCGALMTGCMDGSDDPAPAGPTAQPSNNGDSSAAASYLFAVTDPNNAAKLNLVNASSGVIGLSLPIDASTTAKAAQAFTVNADGSQTAGLQKDLFYVSAGKLYKIGLQKAAGVALTPAQVSSESHVCDVMDVVPNDASATASWVRISTADTGSCDPGNPLTIKLVASTASSSTAGVTSPLNGGTGPNQDAVLDVHRDAQGKLTQVLAFDSANRKLVAFAPNATGSGLTAADIGDGSVPAEQSVSFFGKVAGSTDKIYLRVGSNIRVLDWSASPLKLVSTPTNVNMSDMPFVHTDGNATYFTDVTPSPDESSGELALWAMSGTSAATKLTPLATGMTASNLTEVQADSVMTPSSLALVLLQPMDPVSHPSGTGKEAVLRIIKKADGTHVDVPLGTITDNVRIEAHAGEVLVISQGKAGAAEGPSGEIQLLRVDLSTASPTPMAITTLPSVDNLVARTVDPTQTAAGETQNPNLIWSTTTQINSYALPAGGSATLVSGSTSASSWNSAQAPAANMAAGTQGLLIGPAGSASTDSLWLFDANKAGSLSKVSK